MEWIVKHTLADEASIRKMLEGYRIGSITTCYLLTRGLNDTYQINTPRKRYIYRLYRHGWRSREAVQFEIEALLHLKEKSYRLSVPISRQDGSYITETAAPEGIRYGVLFSYVEGERPEIRPEHARLIGESLGKLHNGTDDFQPEADRGFELDATHLLEEPSALILPYIRKFLGREAEGDIEELASNLKTRLEHLDLEKGFCHGDFHPRNMHGTGSEMEVFDFDAAAFGYRAYDVAAAWWNLLTNYGEQEQECWGAFLDGYQAQRRLKADDWEGLPLFITARRFWLLGMMLQNDDVWGTNWITKRSMELFVLQVKTDMIREM
ncbi:phosphotransferase enzyme family protein [Virgibacillus xinjiangensis]|uniref:Phosphotransferase enzyme family protein n=1 Tax=Virgibacillus xinjiangensis TaxID=393090 RepID=A0ABV7CQT6_9BACI